MGSPYDFEFHLIWKVASTSFPSYFDCVYGNESVAEVKVGTEIPEGVQVAAAVRAEELCRLLVPAQLHDAQLVHGPASAVGQRTMRIVDFFVYVQHCRTCDKQRALGGGVTAEFREAHDCHQN